MPRLALFSPSTSPNTRAVELDMDRSLWSILLGCVQHEQRRGSAWLILQVVLSERRARYGALVCAFV